MADTASTALPNGIVRVTANNPGPMTFRGTNSYVVGDEEACFVLDPGPEDEAHLEALSRAVAGRRVEALVLTHRHGDHSGLVARARTLFDAPLLAAASPERSYQASVDFGALVPDETLADGQRLDLAGHPVEVVATPGHTSDHLSFALPETGLLFSGDHVMGWSTTVIIPPDGSMRNYRASLSVLLARKDDLYLPGHGDPVAQPHRLVRSILAHRAQREAMILAALKEGPARLHDLVARLYPNLEGPLAIAASYSVKAHLAELHARGAISGPDPVTSEGPFALD
ncbi:MBL fold metallo-hydrolase [Fulvimarina endophytica]|nr:MBL fold metallo-hydrolase [Fulvimarina endophytica]